MIVMQCTRCPDTFAVETRRGGRKYCDKCRVIVDRINNLNDVNRARARRNKEPITLKPRRRLIPYAGKNQ